ncbi:hypothetical protein [Burkholderia pseudomallei]|uniref:hypothetical protein n=1 Tax=Burkholderia pseudomallei TaxID=28450 RepID=UPI0011AB35E0|nr:hypothetical protein [Burkholderia pseudomallei]
MSLAIETTVEQPDEVALRKPLPVFKAKFVSRNATFMVKSDREHFETFAVSINVGPLGMWLNADEAEALGKSMIEAAEHWRRVVAAA